MSILCSILGHSRPAEKPIWNDGYFFARCGRCGDDIVRRGQSRAWRDVPKGHRISWRDRTEWDIRW